MSINAEKASKFVNNARAMYMYACIITSEELGYMSHKGRKFENIGTGIRNVSKNRISSTCKFKVGMCEHYLNGIKIFSERELKVSQVSNIYNYSDILRIYLKIITVAMPVVTIEQT